MSRAMSTPKSITLNGAPHRSSAATIADLVRELELAPTKVAVERNLEVVPRSTLAEVKVEDGDELEIVHFVGGVAPGAAAESGQIAVGDLLVVVNGKDCSKLDGKQVQAIVLGLEGSPITMEFVRGNPEVATPRSDNERFQVDLIRGGSEYKKRLEDGETAYNKMIEQYEKQF
jgi:thiamine biosynthesis protein ThiS